MGEDIQRTWMTGWAMWTLGRWQTNKLEHNMSIHRATKIGTWVLLCHPMLLSFSFFVIWYTSISVIEGVYLRNGWTPIYKRWWKHNLRPAPLVEVTTNSTHMRPQDCYLLSLSVDLSSQDDFLVSDLPSLSKFSEDATVFHAVVGANSVGANSVGANSVGANSVGAPLHFSTPRVSLLHSESALKSTVIYYKV